MTVMDGVLIIDKPAGLTSHDVVARVRRILGERRVGHTGTLDPFATGVLVLMVGRATRLAQFLNGAVKEYEAVIRLGYATDTGDLTGERIPGANGSPGTPPTWREDEIANAIASLCGEIEQIPPMYSAKKVGGRKLYELARRGEEIARKAVPITIHEFAGVAQQGRLLTKSEAGAASDLVVRVVCSAGAYIRTLATDLGTRLGVGAHLVALRRTRAGDFSIADGLTLAELQQRSEESPRLAFAAVRLSMNAALARFPLLVLAGPEVQRVLHGLDIAIGTEPGSTWTDGEKVRIGDEDGNLLAIGFFDGASRMLHPQVVLGAEP